MLRALTAFSLLPASATPQPEPPASIVSGGQSLHWAPPKLAVHQTHLHLPAATTPQPEPFAREAKYFTETKCLGQEVRYAFNHTLCVQAARAAVEADGCPAASAATMSTQWLSGSRLIAGLVASSATAMLKQAMGTC